MILPPVLERSVQVLTAAAVPEPGGAAPWEMRSQIAQEDGERGSFDLQVVIAFIIIVTELLCVFF